MLVCCLFRIVFSSWLLLSLALAEMALLPGQAVHRLLQGGAKERAKEALVLAHGIDIPLRSEVRWMPQDLLHYPTNREADSLVENLRRSRMNRGRDIRTGSIRVNGKIYQVSAHTLDSRPEFQGLEERFWGIGSRAYQRVLTWIIVCEDETRINVFPPCGLLGVLETPHRLRGSSLVR